MLTPLVSIRFNKSSCGNPAFREAEIVMESIRCRNCHLVNLATHAKCRRCGIELIPKKVKGPKQPTGGYSLPVKLVIAGAAAFVVYSYFGPRHRSGSRKPRN